MNNEHNLVSLPASSSLNSNSILHLQEGGSTKRGTMWGDQVTSHLLTITRTLVVIGGHAVEIQPPTP